MHNIDGPAGEPLGVVDGPGVTGCQAVEDAADDHCGLVRQDRAVPLRRSPDPRGHVVRRDEGRVIGIDPGPAGRQLRGAVQQVGQGNRRALRGPGPLAFAQEPESADVAQVADGAVNAASLVKFASRLASVSTGCLSSMPTNDHVPEEM